MPIIYGLFDPRDAVDLQDCRYVGQTIHTANERLAEHLTTASSGTRRHVYNWIRKVRRACETPTIIVIEDIDDDVHDDVLGILVDDAERDWIAIGRQLGWKLTNQNDGGRGNRGYKHTAETKAKISAIHTGRKMPPRSDDWRRKISEANTGRKQSPEHVAQRAEANRGKRRTPEQRARIGESQRGRVASEETRQRISASKTGVPNPKSAESNRGKVLSEDHKQRIREGVLANLPTGEARERVLEAARSRPSEETKAKMSAARSAWWERKRAADNPDD
jgi:hypothetical protein